MKDNQKIESGSFKTLINRWKDGTFSEILDDWKWIFSYSNRYKGAILLYTLLGIIGTTTGLISAVAGKYSIDIITGYQMDKLWIVVTIMISSVIANLVITNVTSRISAKLSIDINNDIQADIFDGIMDSDWMAISGYANGDIVNRFSNDVSIVSNNAITWLPTIVIAMYNFIATFVVIWHYDKIMSLLAFGTAPFLLLVSKAMIQKQREHGKKVREINSSVMAFEVETFYNYDTIKSFGITELFGKKIRDWQKKQKKVSLDYNMFTIKTNVFMTLIGTVVQYIAFGYCLFRLWTHDITYGTMTLFLQQRGNLSGAFNNLVAIIPNFLNSSISAHRILELVQLPREEHIPDSSKMDAYQEYGFTVTMKDIDFSYVEGKQILKDSSFVANPGEIIALVGPSGEGKTTMIRLILGLIKPDSGTVQLHANQKSGADSEEKVEMNADTRHLIAYVPQGNTIFSGTIAENLRMVREDATEEEIIEALKSACAWEFVQKLNGNIHYRLGERGKGLSEGQAQRIAIARALLKDAPILLLDEATSALDVATERQVLKNIIQNHPSKTCIVTTHRPSVLNMCQKVYRVIENRTAELTEEEAGKMAIDF